MLTFVLLTCLQQVEPRRQNRQHQQGHSGDSPAPACLNENGNPIDWYIAYKFPDLSSQRSPFNTGFAYAYITSDRLKSANQHNGNTDSYWTVSSLLISDKQSLIMRTLASAFKGRPHGNPNSIFYNDQPPKEDRNDTSSGNTSRAHAKGVILIDDISGRSIWLTHSVSVLPADLTQLSTLILTLLLYTRLHSFRPLEEVNLSFSIMPDRLARLSCASALMLVDRDLR